VWAKQRSCCSISKKITEKIQQLKDSNLRKDIIALGLENVQKFSWDKTTDNLLALYNKINQNLIKSVDYKSIF
jgi:glycosyltransferase involved in cell wall biosynthesis